MFLNHFNRYACEGDTIECTVDGITLIARIYRDDSTDEPDERDEGFWPSLNPKSAGYIGPRQERTLARHMKRAKAVMEAWRNDEWFYCGIAVTAWKDDIQLTGEYDHALWGIECNYPVTGKRHPNAYLRDVANELAEDALIAARVAIRLLAGV